MWADFLGPGDPAWGEFLEAVPHDFYHLPGYVELCAAMEGGEPGAFLVRDGEASMLVPLLLRPIPGGDWRDACSPYGYPCPLFRGNPERGEALLAAFARAGAEAGLVSAFLRLHPLLPLPPEPFLRLGTLVDHGETVYLDLRLDPAELDRQTRGNHREDVRKLLARGFRVVLDDWSRLEEFVGIYHDTMEYRGAGASYVFDGTYFPRLLGCLGDRLHLGMVLGPGGEAAGGGLFTRVGGLMQFHLAGTAREFRWASPVKVLTLHMRDQARAWGVGLLHLGGGVGCAQDSLAYFKQGFSRLRSRFSTFRLVMLPRIYGELAPAPVDSFFPAYRRP